MEANNYFHSFRRQGTLKMKQNDDHQQLKVQARNNDVVVVEDRNVSFANGSGEDFQPRQNTDGKSTLKWTTDTQIEMGAAAGSENKICVQL